MNISLYNVISLGAAVAAAALLYPAAAFAQMYEKGPVQSTAEAGVNALMEAARVAGQRSVLNAKFAQLRREYFEDYRTGRNLKAAGNEYKEYLHAKDLHYLELYLGIGTGPRAIKQIQGMEALTGGPLDGGIPRSARVKFDVWVNKVRWELGTRSLDQLLVPGFGADFRPENVQRALAAAKSEYETYQRARDLADFVAQGVTPPKELGGEAAARALKEAEAQALAAAKAAAEEKARQAQALREAQLREEQAKQARREQLAQERAQKEEARRRDYEEQRTARLRQAEAMRDNLDAATRARLEQRGVARGPLRAEQSIRYDGSTIEFTGGDGDIAELEAAANAGNARACLLLGELIVHGRIDGTMANAASWFEKGYLRRDPECTARLARLLIDGHAGEANPRFQTPQMWRQLASTAASRGSALGMYLMAECSARGIGMRPSEPVARQWYQKAAAAGHPLAQQWCEQNGVSYASMETQRTTRRSR
jgi:hypothetical protein